ncbi:MAG TPA: hypothetical protein PLX89_23650, partial [Verrucomicrobiota bacterium]|nr:hypothetical protein [Verrucomicrobiota bacterium]
MNRLLLPSSNSHRYGPLIAALTLSAGLAHASTFAFEALSSGTFTYSGAPIVDIHIDHTTVSATPFSFSTLTADQTVNLLDLPPSLVAAFNFETAGGEDLYGTYEGVILPGDNANQLFASATFLFTGGTGFFSGASGSGDLFAVIDITGPDSGVSSIAWKGTLNTVPESGETVLVAGAMLGVLGWLLSRQ